MRGLGKLLIDACGWVLLLVLLATNVTASRAAEEYDGAAVIADQAPALVDDVELSSVQLSPREYLFATYPSVAPALDRIIACESGWDPWAKNPRSTASGLAQFLNTTWAGTPQARAGLSVFDGYANVDGAVWLYGQSGAWPWLASNGCHRQVR